MTLVLGGKIIKRGDTMGTDYNKVKRNNLDTIKPEGFKMEPKNIPVEVAPEKIEEFNEEYDKKTKIAPFESFGVEVSSPNDSATNKEVRFDIPYDPTQKDLDVMMVCNCKFVNVRKNPSKKADVVQILEVKQAVSILPCTEVDWKNVSTTNGKKGYIMTKFLRGSNVWKKQ